MSITQGLEEAYVHYQELWNLCERLLVSVPRRGERCFYFPQGHFEQLNFSTEQEFHHGASHFNVPSQILCRVLNIQILVEPETSEIYYCFTLIPDPQSDPTVPDPTRPAIQREEIHSIFSLLMTSLITSTHGVSARQESPIPSSSESSSQNVHLAALATASHSVITGAMFMVYYKLRTSQYVIRLNKYLEAMNQNIHVGMRFKKRFQREDSLDEISFYGTIVGIRNFSLQWPNSKWRSLQVQWDGPASIQKPERVSPWEIEPILAPGVWNVSNALSVKITRFRPRCIPSSKLAFNSSGSVITWKGSTSKLL
ncbi:hypothetical protein K1719_030725 [Acacia pycnantha]|nr:hypothetical protein K1719_030725 [Acacia pycnantha]